MLPSPAEQKRNVCTFKKNRTLLTSESIGLNIYIYTIRCFSQHHPDIPFTDLHIQQQGYESERRDSENPDKVLCFTVVVAVFVRTRNVRASYVIQKLGFYQCCLSWCITFLVISVPTTRYCAGTTR
jgi:hypothetical protein